MKKIGSFFLKTFYPRLTKPYFRLHMLPYVIVMGVACILTGCLADDAGYAPPPRYEPITLSLKDLRSPITAQIPMSIQENGKIVLYGNYLLVNEPMKGVHIFDNTDPKKPIALAFLPILGVTDVSIKNNVLYADSYIDLVAFDISDMSDIKTLHRLEKAFPSSYYASAYGVDEREEIVIGVIKLTSQGGM